MQNVRYKLSYNVDPDPVIARGDLVNRLVEQRIEENESFGLFVSNKSLSAEQGLGSALAVLGNFFAAIQQQRSGTSLSAHLRMLIWGLSSGISWTSSLRPLWS